MHLTIIGPPIPKLRHRNRGKIYYDPQEAEKCFIKTLMTKFLEREFSTQDKQKLKNLSLLTNATSFDVAFVFRLSIADSLTTAQKNAKLWGFQTCNVKPDLDNLEKFYCDCANKILFEDDRMIVHVTKRKIYSEKPRTEITIMPTKQINIKPSEKNALLQFGPEKIKTFREDINRISSHLSIFNNLSVSESHQSISDYLHDLTHVEREEWLGEMGRLLCQFAASWSSDLKKLESKNKSKKDQVYE